MPPVLVFQLEVFYKVDRLLTGLTAQEKETTARWYSNKTSLFFQIMKNYKGFIFHNFSCSYSYLITLYFYRDPENGFWCDSLWFSSGVEMKENY